VDTTPPTVSSTSPVAAATAVARNNILTATFDEDIFAVTVNAASFSLAKSGSGNISSTVSFDGVNNVASLIPNRKLAVLASYTATLSTAITDLSGNALAVNYSWSFTTADVAWSTAELIETNNAGDADSPRVAFDGNGNAIAVWSQYDGARDNIWASRFDGTSWDAAELIETDNAGDAYGHKIAFDGNGNAIVVWSQYDGVSNNIWANRFDGTSWGAATLIETDNAGDAYSPVIAFDGNGNALAAWFQSDGVRNNIWANRFDGTSWGAATLIETDNAGGASAPKITFDGNGNAIAVWHQSDGARSNIWANRFDGTSWGAATLIETDNAGEAVFPDIAFDGNGNALAVWSQSDGIRANIWANRFDGTSWGTATLIETDDAGEAVFPDIAFDSNGNALAAWHQSDGVRNNIWANRFDGTSWGTATLIETDNTGGAGYPQIAFDGNGNALAVWYQSDGVRNNIWANRFE